MPPDKALSSGSAGVLLGVCSCENNFKSDADYNRILENIQSAKYEVENKFAPKKVNSGKLADVYYRLGYDSRATRVRDCGTWLQWAVTESDWRLQHANFCRDRLCPMCNWRRSMKIFSQVSRIMDVLENDYDFIFATFTVKNCSAEQLPATVSALFDGWRFLYHKDKDFRKVVLGSFRGLEITRNVNRRSKSFGTYHPHLHTILAVKKSYWKKGYLTQRQWTDMWKNACDLDYQPIVNVKKIMPKLVDNGHTVEMSLASAVAEVAKYAVKDSDYLTGTETECADTVSAFLSALSRRRLVSTTGVFLKVQKQLALDDMENGDLLLTDEGQPELRSDVLTLIVTYTWKCGQYVQYS